MTLLRITPSAVRQLAECPTLAEAVATGAAATQRITSIGVVVPARDEEDTIGECLTAIARAAALVRAEVRTVLVLDRCQDGTAAIARQFAGVTVIRTVPGQHGVGAARAAGVAELLRPGQQAPTWLATTDADSAVPADWLTRQLSHAHAGADVVIGTVRVADWAHRDQSLRQRYLAAYGHSGGAGHNGGDGHPRGRAHSHMHGANLSFRASAYESVGGFEAVATDEDVRIIRRFEAAGRVLVWAADLPVVTSARQVGRAPAGFADYLSQLAAAPSGRLATPLSIGPLAIEDSVDDAVS